MSKQKSKKLEDLRPPYSDKDLYDLGITEMPYIIKPLIPAKSLVLLNAESNVGKSVLLRQISHSVAYGESDFCGFEIKKPGKVVMLSSEDNPESLSFYFNMLPKKVTNKLAGNVSFFNEPETFLRDLKELSKQVELSLVMVDAFGDVFDGSSSNSSEDVRHFYQGYQSLCNEYGYSVVFLHHNNKASYKQGANKNNSAGSQAIQAKPRVTIEISRSGEDEIRILSLGKHNYISDKELRMRYKLKFKNLYYSLVDKFEHVSTDKKLEKKEEIKERILHHYDNGTTKYRDIEVALIEDGFKSGDGIGRTSIASILKEHGLI